MTERETEIELGTSAAEGISSFTAHDRLIDNGRNTPERTYAPNIAHLAAAQLKNLYTAAFFLMGAVTLALDFKEGRAAWIIFFLIAGVNMAIGLRNDLRDRRTALRFDERRADSVRIIRDGKEVESNPALLVKGDVILLGKGDFVPADARILECENLKADESIFRRNSVPVAKRSDRMETECEITECYNMLYCGTHIVQGSAKAAVVQTGGETELAKMTESRSKKLSLQDSFAKNTPTEKVLVSAALFFAVLILAAVGFKTRSAKDALLAAFTAALCLLPAAVRAVRLASMRACSARLSKTGVTFGEKDFVYNIGSVDYLLFDKGKMLTDSDLKLEEKVVLSGDALNMAALCGDSTVTETGAAGGDIDAAAVNAVYAAGVDVKKLFEENERLLFKPFDDSRNLMASVHRRENGFRLIAKGSIEAITMLCTAIDGENGVGEISGETMHRMETLASSMAERGLKVRALAYKDLDALPENIEDEINSLVFEGLFGYREVMTPKAGESIKSLEDNFIRPIAVTGDNTITAAAVAKEAGLVKSEKECISFRDLSEASDGELLEAVGKYKVFANASRSDRVRLVSVLSENGGVTAVAGDQMTAQSVRMCANVSIGKEDEGDYDVSLKRLSFENAARVIADCRTMRSNMTASSLLAAAVGLAEALLMLFAALTESIFPFDAAGMLVLNLFITFFPLMALGLFGHTRIRERGRNTALTVALHGFTGAVFAIASLSAGLDAALMFFAVYAVFDAAGINFAKIRRKADKRDFYLVLSLMLCAAVVIIAANSTVFGLFGAERTAGSFLYAAMYAALAAFINFVLTHARMARS